MKRTIFIFTILLFTAACERDISYHRNGIPDMLAMNAQLSSADSIHVVHLAVSNDVTIKEITSGSVKCYVNGKLAAEGIAVNGDKYVDSGFDGKENFFYIDLVKGNAPSKMLQRSFAFKARFKPGDLVRLEATADGDKYSAWSEVTVPKAPQFEVTDTLTEKENGSESKFTGQQVLRVRLSGKDIAGEKSFYRLSARARRAEVYYSESSSGTDTSAVQYSSGYLSIDKGNDAILNDGAPAEKLDVTGVSENSFSVFTDNLFSDSSFDIRFTVQADPLKSSSGDISKDSEDLDAELEVMVSGISKTEYNYLKALSLYAQTSDGFSLTGPVSFPDNVENGVGVVSISTPAAGKVRFPRRHFSFRYY